MRWLIGHPGPQFSVADVYEGWAEALRGLGEDVYEFNLDRRLQVYDAALAETGNADGTGHPQVRKMFTQQQAIMLAAGTIFEDLYKWWPHVVLLISAFFYPPEFLDIMRDRGHKVVLLMTESPYQDDEQLARAAHADLTLLNDPVNIARYRDVCRAEYMPHRYRESVHHPGPGRADLRSDLAFVGTGFASRIRFFEAMHATGHLGGLDVLLAGVWPHLAENSPLRKYLADGADELVQCTDNDETAEIYRSTRAGINFYRREAEDTHLGEGWAAGPREIEMAATRLFFLRDPRPEGDELFPMLPVFDGPEDAAEKLRWWLARDSAREAAAAAAREAVSDRTFTNGAIELLKLLGEQGE